MIEKQIAKEGATRGFMSFTVGMPLGAELEELVNCVFHVHDSIAKMAGGKAVIKTQLGDAGGLTMVHLSVWVQFDTQEQYDDYVDIIENDGEGE